MTLRLDPKMIKKKKKRIGYGAFWEWSFLANTVALRQVWAWHIHKTARRSKWLEQSDEGASRRK